MKDTQHTLRYDDPKTICTTAKMSAKEFKDFKSFLNIIKSDFNDFSLVGGAFRSFSNSYACVVETGFGFFSDMHFDIFKIKEFIKSISTLDKKTSITVTTDENSLIFEDHTGNIQFSRGNPEFLDNKFVSDKETMETLLNNVDPNKLIVSEAIPKINVCRLKTVSRRLRSGCICLKHDKNDLNKGFLSMVGESGNSTEFQIELKKPLLIPMKKNHYFNLKILPTLFNKDDMYLKCYLTNDQKIFAIYSTKVNDLFVNIYSTSELIEESEER
jgi:hypothetical protein